MTSADPQPTSVRGATLGPLLVELRNARGMAQKEVARLADIDNSTLSRLESGERGVSRDVLERICAVLELDRRERIEVLVAAGFLTHEAGQILADEEISRLARLMLDPNTAPEDIARLRQFLSLALAYADARGYDANRDQPGG